MELITAGIVMVHARAGRTSRSPDEPKPHIPCRKRAYFHPGNTIGKLWLAWQLSQKPSSWLQRSFSALRGRCMLRTLKDIMLKLLARGRHRWTPRSGRVPNLSACKGLARCNLLLWLREPDRICRVLRPHSTVSAITK